MAYKAIATQILNAVAALVTPYANEQTPKPWRVGIRRDSKKNPLWNPGESLPCIIITGNDGRDVAEGTAIKVFCEYVVTVRFMKLEGPGGKLEDEQIRLAREQIRQTLHVIQIGDVRDVAGQQCLNDVKVRDGQPYDIHDQAQTVNVSGMIFTYQTFETRTGKSPTIPGV